MNGSLWEWQNELRKSVKPAFTKLGPLGIKSGYAIIAAAAILPILTSGSSLLTALSALVGGIGADLISNLVQGAKDEVDLAQKIENLPSNAPTYQAINELLSKLDAFNIARQELPESDWVRLESLLDRKFTQYIGGEQNFQFKCPAPVLTEKVDRSHAREIAYRVLMNAWWSESPRSKSNLQLCHWAMAFYDAQYLVKYQNEYKEEVKDSDGKVISVNTHTTEGTSNRTVQLIVFPGTATQRFNQDFQQRVYDAINGFTLERELDWGRNILATMAYKYLCVRPYLESYIMLLHRYPTKIERVRYWEDARTLCDSSPGIINISEKDIIEDARHVANTSLVKGWNLLKSSVLDTRSGQEQLRIVQYPFWLFEANSMSGLCKVVIEGLGGNVVFIHAPANLISHLLVSVVGFVAITIIAGLVIMIVGMILWAVYLIATL